MTQQPVVSTAYGSVRGTLAEGEVAAFKGIPYAAPPVGTLRFRPPEPPARWGGVREAGAYGPTAPKAPYAPPLDALLPEVDIPGDDFLNLNVWTPDTGGRLPVMVWVHGGGFVNGSGSAPVYDGTRFALHGVVLVTLNYRLGADGFLYLGDGASPNLGLLDQIAALEWVAGNIAAFGGDPDQVTVFGESAGAMSIGALLATERATGLFHRAVLQSGAAHHVLTPDTAHRLGRHLAELLGVEPTRQALAAVPTGELVLAQRELRGVTVADPERWGEAALNLMPFEPVVDGALLPTAPHAAIAAGAGAGVDLLLGSNSDEFRLFLTPNGVLDQVTDAALHRATAAYGLDPEEALAVYRAARPGATPGELLAAVATDWFYRIPAVRLAEARTAHRAASAHLYEFAWRPPTYGGRLGACHAAEIPFVFDNLHEGSFAGILGTEPPGQLAEAMHRAWVSFATTGDPGWAPYDTATRPVMRFDTAPELVHDPRGAERALWEGRR
ncbi:carboxylesterase/lipase family protein [Streptomyces physcomitrii]|uniref:carboxylesterase/lipase family protein n=1 Tax=Streptomyces physcomitrii TaxID=2724184 RepID=UPI0033F34F1B